MRRLLAPVVLCASMVLVATACREPSRTAADEWFVAAMVPHHRLGLELMSIAERSADDVRLRRLVFEMSGYHHDELHELDGVLRRWRLAEAEEFPGRVDLARSAELAERPGTHSDVMWLDAMIEHHEGAIVLARQVIETGSRSDLRSLAERIIDVQQAEIDEMRTLRDVLTRS
jgi:uncharacterized protein (DUF305 family)